MHARTCTCTHRDARTYAHTQPRTRTRGALLVVSLQWGPLLLAMPVSAHPPPLGCRRALRGAPTACPAGYRGAPTGSPTGVPCRRGGGRPLNPTCTAASHIMNIHDVHAHIGAHAGASMRAHCRASSSQRAASTCPPAAGATAPGAHGVGLAGVALTHGMRSSPLPSDRWSGHRPGARCTRPPLATPTRALHSRPRYPHTHTCPHE
jgi:hypothetical protein